MAKYTKVKIEANKLNTGGAGGASGIGIASFDNDFPHFWT